MRSEEAKKVRIQEIAIRAFMTRGVSHITMEEIARSAGVGKGTLYQLFPSKEDLMLCSIDSLAAKMDATIAGVVSDRGRNSVEKLKEFIRIVTGTLSAARPEVLAEVERIMPEAYDKINREREKSVLKNFVSLLREGKETGLYDPAADELLVAHILIGTLRHITQPQVMTTLNYNFENLLKSLLSVVLKGCMTEEGRRLIV